jgi:hypothetical protein
MIAKQVPMRSIKKSSVGDLVKYITDEREHQEMDRDGPENLVDYMTTDQGKLQRVGAVTATNCRSTDPCWAAAEMTATQKRNKRAESDKTFHMIISFREGEKPSPEVLKAVEARLCEALGFGEHQRISAVHHDTDNVHVHVAINKIHPTRFTILEPFQSHKIMALTCQALEQEFGLEQDNHDFEKGRAVGRAADMTAHSGLGNLIDWIQAHCREDLEKANTWKEFKTVLAANDLRIKARANGFVFETHDGIRCKASSVSRFLSKPALEKRLGPLPNREQRTRRAERGQGQRARAASTRPAVRAGRTVGLPIRFYALAPKGASPEKNALYEQYKAAQAQEKARKEKERAAALAEMNRKIEAAHTLARMERAAIRLTCSETEARLAYLAIRLRNVDAIKTARRNYHDRRADIQKRFPPTTFKAWQASASWQQTTEFARRSAKDRDSEQDHGR